MPTYEIHCRYKHGPHMSDFDEFSGTDMFTTPYDAAIAWAKRFTTEDHWYPLVVFVRRSGTFDWLRIAVHLEHVPTYTAKLLHGDSPINAKEATDA
jgi:hypothetical protein